MLSSDLSPDERRLLDILRLIQFGSMTDLQIRNGQPVLSPMPRVTCERRMKGQAPPAEVLRNHELKTQSVEFVRYLHQVRNGTIPLVQVKGGLPFKVELEGLHV